MPATLYVVATPIGNLSDISLRALEVLQSVALIACEDTRTTRRLLERHGIKTRTISYHEHNERSRAPQLTSRLESGEDIGSRLRRRNAGRVRSWLSPGRRRSGEGNFRARGPGTERRARRALGLRPPHIELLLLWLPASARLGTSSGHRVPRFDHTHRYSFRVRKADSRAARGTRRAPWTAAGLPCREITKVYEEHRAGALSDLASWVREKPPRGELTLVMRAPSGDRRLPYRHYRRRRCRSASPT